MIKVFFDTNIMIDVIGRREQFCQPSLQIMSLADRGLIRVYVSALSYATASFILGRDNKELDIFREFAKFMKITTATPVDSRRLKNRKQLLKMDDKNILTRMTTNETQIIHKELM